MNDIASFFKINSGHKMPKNMLTLEPSPLILNSMDLKKRHQIIWEYRMFWPQSASSVLLDLSLFNINSLNQFQKRTLNDVYIGIKDRPLNLKIRREKLVYKPIIEQHGGMIAYGYKKKFKFPINWLDLYALFPRIQQTNKLYLTFSHFLSELRENGYDADLIPMEKKVYRYKTEKGCGLEITECEMYSKRWFSICVEGNNYDLVKQAANELTQDKGEIMGYIDFLNKYKKFLKCFQH